MPVQLQRPVHGVELFILPKPEELWSSGARTTGSAIEEPATPGPGSRYRHVVEIEQQTRNIFVFVGFPKKVLRWKSFHSMQVKYELEAQHDALHQPTRPSPGNFSD